MNDKAIWATILAIVLFVIGIDFYDASELTPHFYQGTIADKWHEKSCSPNYDSNGNYYGDSCSDEYVLVLNIENRRIQESISQNFFYNRCQPGQAVNYRFDTGKLGFKHNVSIVPISN